MFGPIPDLLLGCGLVYCVAFAALSFAGDEVRAAIPLDLMPLVVLCTGVPHYGATLLRVYQRSEDRHRYAFFAIYATAIVWATFVWGVYELAVGSFLVTLYLTWSPWHYAGQNYGIAVMFLRRRGVGITSWAKRLLQWSFTLSFGLTILAMHGDQPEVAYAPGETTRSAYQVLALGIPSDIVAIAVPLLTGAYLTCLTGAAVLLRRAATWRDLLPTGLLVGTQALWFSVPMLARHAGVLQDIEPLSTRHTTYTFLWIAVAHSVQYLWITTYYARREPNPPARLGYLGKVLIAGAGIWVVPGLLFAPSTFGTVPYDAGLAILVAAAVNVHHFVLDGAIWKLRDGAIARILLRGEGTAGATKRQSPLIGWALAAVGTVSVGVFALGPLESAAGNRAAERGDLTRLETAQQRLRWIGRDSGLTHAKMALAYQRAGKTVIAQHHVELAASFPADFGTSANLAMYYMHARQFDAAYDAAQAAHELRPESARVNGLLAQLLMLRTGSNRDDVERAVALAEHAVATTTDEKANHLRTLAAAYAAAGRMRDAQRAARDGLAEAREGTKIHSWFAEQIGVYENAARRAGQ